MRTSERLRVEVVWSADNVRFSCVERLGVAAKLAGSE